MRPRFWLTAWVVLVPAALIAGCGSNVISEAIPDQRLAYKKQQEAQENLAIPPDLTTRNFDDALDVPPIGGTTYSEYSGTRVQRQRVATSGDILPEVPNVELKRRDSERWLEVQASPQAVWPRVIAFWREQGILLVEQDPAVGVMRTDWLDNRAEIRRDFVTRMISKVAEGVYATSTRDQYTVRLETGPRPGTTEIYLSHRGMEEKLVTNAIGDGSRTIWEPSPTDPTREAEMLRRLMVFLGASEQRAGAVTSATVPAASTGGSALGTRLVSEGGATVLVMPEDFRRAWRTTGSALSRAGFAIEDRDMTNGTFYVRYGADEDGSEGERKGFMSRLAFWRQEEVDPVKQYQVRLQGDDIETRVAVLDENGAQDTSEAGRTILTLLQEHMR